MWIVKQVRQEPGQAIVEFALTALIFLTLLVFSLDGSRIFWQYLTVTEAARVARGSQLGRRRLLRPCPLRIIENLQYCQD
jgi:hypothetical protein